MYFKPVSNATLETRIEEVEKVVTQPQGSQISVCILDPQGLPLQIDVNCMPGL